MNNLYVYWEGNDRHWFYDLCLRTIKHHNPAVVILGEKDVEDITGGKIPKFLDGVCIPHKCDWIRKAVVHKTGGAWVDMDYCCWQSLDFLRSMSSDFDMVTWDQWDGATMDNFFAGRAGSKSLEAALQFIKTEFTAHGPHVSWLTASNIATDKGLEANRWGRNIKIPTHMVSPYSYNSVDFFFSEQPMDDVSGHNGLGVMFSFHHFRDRLRGLTEKDILEGNLGISRIFQRALQ